MPYLITIGDEDAPDVDGGWMDDLDAALDRARQISKRVEHHHPPQGSADVRVWEASTRELGPTLDRVVARFEDGERLRV